MFCKSGGTELKTGAIYQNAEGAWCRKCPTCSTEISHASFINCRRSHRAKTHCMSCGHVGKGGHQPSSADVAKFREAAIAYNYSKQGRIRELQASGKIWQEGLRWYKSCPSCGKKQSYTGASICVKFYEKDSKCNSCAKSGKNNPLFGKELSLEHREKLRIAGTGQLRPKTEATRRKISITKRTNRKLKASVHNGNNQFKRKPFILPSGKVVQVQGYEPETLNLLVTEGHTDIAVEGKERPVFSYQWANDEFLYIPDCYIKTLNTVVETKSTWTWNSQRDRNLAKLKGVLLQGVHARLIVWKQTNVVAFDQTFTSETELTSLRNLVFAHSRYGEEPILAVNHGTKTKLRLTQNNDNS